MKKYKICGFCLGTYESWPEHIHACPQTVKKFVIAKELDAAAGAPSPWLSSGSNAAQRGDEPALRYDAGKSRVDLIDPGFILHLGEHYAVGAKKYAERNWQKGMSYSRCYASAQRHLLAFWGGEDLDPETGTRHVIAVAWNMAALDFYMSRPELAERFDDRPEKSR